jgi:hypothetical protein
VDEGADGHRRHPAWLVFAYNVLFHSINSRLADVAFALFATVGFLQLALVTGVENSGGSLTTTGPLLVRRR